MRMRSDSEQFTFWFLDLSFIVQSLSHRVLIPPPPTASFFPGCISQFFRVIRGCGAFSGLISGGKTDPLWKAWGKDAVLSPQKTETVVRIGKEADG